MKCNVLLLEHPDVAPDLERKLRALGCDVATISENDIFLGGRLTVELTSGHFDVVLLTTASPFGDGMDLYKRAKQDLRTRAVPFILMSDDAVSSLDLLPALGAGDVCVPRPVNERDLTARLQRIEDAHKHVAETTRPGPNDELPGDDGAWTKPGGGRGSLHTYPDAHTLLRDAERSLARLEAEFGAQRRAYETETRELKEALAQVRQENSKAERRALEETKRARQLESRLSNTPNAPLLLAVDKSTKPSLLLRGQGRGGTPSEAPPRPFPPLELEIAPETLRAKAESLRRERDALRAKLAAANLNFEALHAEVLEERDEHTARIGDLEDALRKARHETLALTRERDQLSALLSRERDSSRANRQPALGPKQAASSDPRGSVPEEARRQLEATHADALATLESEAEYARAQLYYEFADAKSQLVREHEVQLSRAVSERETRLGVLREQLRAAHDALESLRAAKATTGPRVVEAPVPAKLTASLVPAALTDRPSGELAVNLHDPRQLLRTALASSLGSAAKADQAIAALLDTARLRDLPVHRRDLLFVLDRHLTSQLTSALGKARAGEVLADLKAQIESSDDLDAAYRYTRKPVSPSLPGVIETFEPRPAPRRRPAHARSLARHGAR